MPFMSVNGSGKNGFCESDDAGGMGGRVHPPLPPLPLCVTVTVWLGAPVAVAVTAAVRAEELAFCSAVTVTVALFDPDSGLTVSHD